MNKTLIGLAAALLCSTALSTAAFATGDGDHSHNCNGKDSCPTTTTNNNYDNDTTNNQGGTGYGGEGGTGYGGEGGQGGQGGEGGEGGDAKAYGGDAKAYGGDVDNHNKNEQDQKQKQKQQQQQQQKQSIRDSGNSEIRDSGNSEINNSGNSRNKNDNSNSNNADQEVNVNTYNERAPVNTAYAAPLAVSEDTCMGSSSIGGQGFSFGLSIGTTWTDENCQRLKNSRQLQALGYAVASVALICTDEDVKAAMIAAGTPCPSAENRKTSAYVAPAPVVQQMVQVETPVVEPAVQQWTVSMAPIPDPVRHQRRAKAKRHETLPPK